MRATLDARSHGRRSSRLRTATNLDKQGGRATVYTCICPVSRESTNSACFKPELTILTRAAPVAERGEVEVPLQDLLLGQLLLQLQRVPHLAQLATRAPRASLHPLPP